MIDRLTANRFLALLLLAALPPLVHGVCRPSRQESVAGRIAQDDFESRLLSKTPGSDSKKKGPASNNRKLAIETNLVNLTVAVADARGQYVPGLTPENFEIFDDQARQQIVHFSDEDVPVSIGIVFD